MIWYGLLLFYILRLADHPHQEQAIYEAIISEAQKYEGKPYKANPLDLKGKEWPEWQTDYFDCVTYVETVLACVLTTYEFRCRTYQENLINLRYRNGVITDYSSRLHYFTEWIQQAENSGIGMNVSIDAGGTIRQKNIYFMTANRKKYAQLANQTIYNTIQQHEKLLSETKYGFIPLSASKEACKKVQSGDVIAFTSTKAGLDVHHTGFIKISNGKPYLLHASSLSGRVEEHKKPFEEYLRNLPDTDGFIIFRLHAKPE